MSLKEQFKTDLAIFFNDLELAELHLVANLNILCVIDNQQLVQRKANDVNGVFQGDLLFYAKADDLVTLVLAVGKPLIFDNAQYIISAISQLGGITEITLATNWGY